MNKIKKVKSVHVDQPIREVAKEKSLDRVKANATNTTVKELGDDEIIQLPARDSLFLRERIEAIQKVKKELGIENQAATTFGILESVLIGAAAGEALRRFFDYLGKSGTAANLNALNMQAAQSLDKHWTKDLISMDDSERKKAMKELESDPLNDPKGVVSNVEEAIKGYIFSSDTKKLLSDQDFVSGGKVVVRGFLTALEALYRRSDTKIQEQMYMAFANYLERPSKFNNQLVDGISEDCMKRILVRNWKVPVVDYKVPGLKRDKFYREKIYDAVLTTLKDGEADPLFLLRSINNVPSNLKDKVGELGDGLAQAFGNEMELKNRDGDNYHQPNVDKLHEILVRAEEGIPRYKWDKEAKNKKIQDEQNKLRFQEFKDWTVMVYPTQEAELRRCFDLLSPEQQVIAGSLKHLGLLGDNMSNFLKDFFAVNEFYSEEDLNFRLGPILDFMSLDSRDGNKRLTHQTSEKGLFFFRYLNALMEKRITFKLGDNSPRVLKRHLSDENKDRLLVACKLVVNDTLGFPTLRDREFFTKPSLDTVPGQALVLNHRLTYCFNEEGYVDLYGVRDPVLTNAVEIFSNTAQTRGFLLSGPADVGKRAFAEALANHLAVNFFEINRDLVRSERAYSSASGFDVTVQLPNGKSGTLEEFTDFVINNSPCVVFFADADKLLVPRKEDEGRDKSKEPTDQEEDLTGKFFSNLDKLHNEAPGVILIMATDKPLTEEIDISLLDKAGHSGEAMVALYRHVSYAGIREGRVDHKTFLFHKRLEEDEVKTKNPEKDRLLKYIQDKLSSLVQSLKKVVKGNLNMVVILRASNGLAPKQIKKALEELTPFELTQENILAAFDQVRSLGS